MKYLILFLLLLPLSLSAQEDDNPQYYRTIKTSLTSPWLGIQSATLSYEYHTTDSTLIEYEFFYSFDVFYPDRPLTLSHLRVALGSNSFSGGVSVFFKRMFNPNRKFFLAYGGGFQHINFQNSHTVCTEVSETTEEICPCLNYEEDIFTRKVNQLSGEVRIGFQTPLSKYHKRLRLEAFLGMGFRYQIVQDIEKLSHVLCSGSLANEQVQEQIPPLSDFFAHNTLDNKYPFFPRLQAGIKLAYAF